MKDTLVVLRKNWEFKRVYRGGRKVFSRYMVLYYLKNGLSYNRYGFSVSKKVGNSVVRHGVKRRFVEVYRRMQRYLPGGYDIVVIGKKAAFKMSYHECYEDAQKILKRAGLL